MLLSFAYWQRTATKQTM
ncbi:hypothetical protein LINPERHAP1_LOCUS41127 [Linum perenne]